MNWQASEMRFSPFEDQETSFLGGTRCVLPKGTVTLKDQQSRIHY